MGAHIIRVDRRRSRTAARRMAAQRMPHHAIIRALDITRQRLQVILDGSSIWDGTALAAIRNEMRRAA